MQLKPQIWKFRNTTYKTIQAHQWNICFHMYQCPNIIKSPNRSSQVPSCTWREKASKTRLYCIQNWYTVNGHKKWNPIESCSNEEKGFYIVICSNELDLFTVVWSVDKALCREFNCGYGKSQKKMSNPWRIEFYENRFHNRPQMTKRKKAGSDH